jgi:hypothetical protein
MMRPRMRIAAGASACVSVRESEAIDRKIIDIVNVRRNDVSTKKKNGPGEASGYVRCIYKLL